MVWSPLGPVFLDGVGPDLGVQSNLSLLFCVNPQSSSKLHEKAAFKKIINKRFKNMLSRAYLAYPNMPSPNPTLSTCFFPNKANKIPNDSLSRLDISENKYLREKLEKMHLAQRVQQIPFAEP